MIRAPLSLALLAACAADVPPVPGPEPAAPPVRPPAAPAVTPRELPEGWDRVAPLLFEDALESVLRAGAGPWSEAALADLEQGLRGQGGVAVRAAVLLAHSPDPTATEALIARLEERAVAPARGLDAGDLVAAAALAGRGLESGVPQRLEALAVGGEPHPDLEVRVECARSALAGGRDGVVPWLVKVLRALTPAEADDPPDWERVETLAWAKSRAAEALSRRAGVPCTFRPDASWADQMAQASDLETLLEELLSRE